MTETAPAPPGAGGSTRSAEWQQRDRVWASALAPREKLVLFGFLEADRRATGHPFYPSVERVAWQTGLSYSTTRQAVATLEQSGILQRVGYVASHQVPRGRVAKFVFHADRLPIRPGWKPNNRRETAPVASDSRRASAPVDAPQPPGDASTGAVPDAAAAESARDSRRISMRQPPGDGTERTYERTEDERTYERTDERVSVGTGVLQTISTCASRISPAPTKTQTTHELAERAYRQLRPAALRQLEHDATALLGGFLSLINHERRKDMVRTQVMRFLEDPVRRRQFAGECVGGND